MKSRIARAERLAGLDDARADCPACLEADELAVFTVRSRAEYEAIPERPPCPIHGPLDDPDPPISRIIIWLCPRDAEEEAPR